VTMSFISGTGSVEVSSTAVQNTDETYVKELSIEETYSCAASPTYASSSAVLWWIDKTFRSGEIDDVLSSSATISRYMYNKHQLGENGTSLSQRFHGSPSRL
jgi:hypothetical protein